ncbi:MAG: radical SAM protein [Candidatus Lokiarchaeota archaeon]|nr:radical SAM protein [Candidatus Lokiarchaeota archaeon]
MANKPSALQLLERVQSRGHLKNHFIVQSLPAGVDARGLEKISAEDAWALHRRLHERFIEKRGDTGGHHEKASPNFLDVKVKLAREMLASCDFCERRCGADRAAGKKGTCRVEVTPRVSSAFLHFGEESPIVPSGTIFFAGCNFACVFCQNEDISTDPENGIPVTPQKLANMATSLAMDGARNVNYVGGDPTPNLHTILESLAYQDSPVAQLWNSNGFSTVKAMRLLLDVIDIWLPDLKYGNDACAKRLSGIDGYWQILTRNLKNVHDEMIVPGHASLVIRHLVMPGHVECCSVPIIEWIAKQVPYAMVNIMGQYRPQHKVLSRHAEFKDIARRPSFEEIDAVRSLATRLGITWKPVS